MKRVRIVLVDGTDRDRRESGTLHTPLRLQKEAAQPADGRPVGR